MADALASPPSHRDRNSLAGVGTRLSGNEETPRHQAQAVVGVRLITTDGFEAIAYPTDRAAYGRLCRLLTQGNLKADKAECHLGFEGHFADGRRQVFIALPPEDFASSPTFAPG